MKYFELIDEFDIKELATQLAAHPELWNTRKERTGFDIFKGTSDIWVRYRDPKELLTPADYGVPHYPVFYAAWHMLPALKPIVHKLMTDVHALHLGGILITKIPAGGHIKPHNDRGGWHAEFFERKVYVPLETNPFVVNRCEDEKVVMGLGEAWYFNNLVEHEVTNNGDTDRITLIVCMNVEK
jgi:hypothetical protein